MNRNRRVTLLLCAVFLLSFAALPSLVLSTPPSVPTGGVVLSQIYGGGGNTGATLKNDFIELFNPGASPVSLVGWSVQYASSSGSSWQVTPLSGSIAAGGYYLVQEAAGAGGSVNLPTPDATGSIAMGSSGGKVALATSTTALSGTCPASASIVDFVGYGGTANCFEGSDDVPALSNTSAALRLGGGCADTNNNVADFSVGAPTPRNSASPLNSCGAATVLSATGEATPNLRQSGDSTLLTVTVTPGTSPTSTGIVVTADLTAIGGPAVQPLFDNATNGDVTSGDNIFSFLTAVTGTTGDKMLPVSVTDAQARSASTTIGLTIFVNLAIHDIQGNTGSSPWADFVVRTEGIVTGRKSNGYFLQMPDAGADGDPTTSEGIFVFTSSAPPAVAAVGNRVSVLGTVAEFRPGSDPFSPPLTEIAGNPGLVTTLVSSGNPLPAPVLLTALEPAPGGAFDQLEKYEGMRVRVDSLTVVAPTGGSVSEASAVGSSNGVFYGVITGVARPFRELGADLLDAAALGLSPTIPRFDTNPERIRVDSDGQPGSPKIEVTSGAVVTNLTGPLDFGFRTYTILPDAAPAPGVSGTLAATPVPVPALNEFTIASFNLERFFDTVNDSGISDVALTPAAFANRLNKASLAIRGVMQSPDILGVVEMENLATLQALADKINADAVAAGDANPAYVGYLEEGNDIGGIDVGFLVKSSRVVVIGVTQEGKATTYIDPNTGLPAILNDRPPLVLEAEILSPIGPPVRVTVIVNHLRSFSDINSVTDGARVRAKRAAQAEFLANLVQARQAADPDERIVLVGDFNAYQFNDGLVDSMGTIKGAPVPADQVLLPTSVLVNPNLANLVELVAADTRYSYVFDGNAQVLDHILISGNLMQSLSQIRIARADADFPESFRADANRPERLSDHDMPVAYFLLPPIEVIIDIMPGGTPNPINLGSNGVVPVAILSTPEFDAGNVDPTTVTLAGASLRLRGRGVPMAKLVDINGDGLRDLLMHFSTPDLQLNPGDTQAVLLGTTYDGKRIRGVDSIRIVPAPPTGPRGPR